MKPMRLPIALTLLSVVLAFVAGYLFLSLQSVAPPKISLKDITALKEKLQSSTKVETEISLASVFPQGSAELFLDPSYASVELKRFSFETVQKIYRSLNSCEMFFGAEDPILAKAQRWIDFQYGRVSKLDPSFFETAPFIFPLGQSYAYLAFENKERLNFPLDWFRQHLAYFHIGDRWITF